MFKSADEAVADIKSGSTILSAGFGLCGTAGKDYIEILMSHMIEEGDLMVIDRHNYCCHGPQRSRELALAQGRF